MTNAVHDPSFDRIGVNTLDRPGPRNAVNPDIAAGSGPVVDQLEDDPEVRVGVLTFIEQREPQRATR